MSEIELRPIREDEFQTAHWIGCVAFGEEVREEEISFSRPGFDLERSTCVFEDGRMVGVSTSLPMELTVPGGRSISAGGLTWVSVLPTHRRRGLLTMMMEAQLRQMTSKGESVSVLLSSEGAIYERFGYGPATYVFGSSITCHQAKLRRPVERSGCMSMLDREAAATELPALFERYRSQRHGEVRRTPGWWEEYLYDPEHHREGHGAMFHAKHVDGEGQPDGYVSYRIKEGWDHGVPAGGLFVVEMVYADLHVYEEIWDYLLGTDLVERVVFSRGRTDEPLRWMLDDPRALKVDSVVDYLWVRILDVRRALEAREYRHPGNVVLEVRHSFPTQDVRRYRLTALPDGTAECREDDSADPSIRMSVEDLGTVYLGGVSFRALSDGGRIHEVDPGAVHTADDMFSTPTPPYCCTLF